MTLNFRQRWATLLTIALTGLALIGGVILRGSVIGATQAFVDRAAGVSARYPAGWLIERGTTGSNFVFRAEDSAALSFKTTLSVAILPIGPNATVYDVIQILTVQRAQTLAAYRSLSTDTYPLPNGAPATRIQYAYASIDPDPFLSAVPVVVRAEDVIILSHSQAIIASYLSEAQTFTDNERYFITFLRGLTY
jgi:hypothetical protein